MFKKILIGVVLLIVIGFGALVIFGLSNIDNVVRMAMETVGTHATKTPVKIETVDLSLTNGKIELQQLQIRNPVSYDSEYAVTMDQLSIQVDPQTMVQPISVVQNITIKGVTLNVDGSVTQGNLQQLLASLRTDIVPGSDEAKQANAGMDKRLAIHQLSITGAKVVLHNEDGTQTLDLQDISLENIGDPATGMAPNEIARAILVPLLEKAQAAAE